MTELPPPEGVSPEFVSAMLRDHDTGPDAPYPCDIGVSCDYCGTTHRGQYVVTDRMTKRERLEAARANLRTLGWSCTSAADLCPPCAALEPTS